MDLLILGGTSFVGRHITRNALERGHRVTLFHRGVSNPGLFPEAHHVLGDRRGDLTELREGTWDAVMDVSASSAEEVERSVQVLGHRVSRYALVSSVAVYADFRAPGITEEAATRRAGPGMASPDYGASKTRAEDVLRAALGERSLIVRPGEIVGPFDNTGRFSYWVARVARGGEILAPGTPARPVQFIDARDLAGWFVRMVEDGRTGIFNAAGPQHRLTFEEFLEHCRGLCTGTASFTWIADDFLRHHGLRPYSDLPFWITDELTGLYSIDSSRAIAAGLGFRPLQDTLTDTLAWLGSCPVHILARYWGRWLHAEDTVLESWRRACRTP